MDESDRNLNLYILEEHHCSRMDELVSEERFEDSNAIFQEMCLDSYKNNEWIFLNDLTNVY
jgi:hypothetical protein